MDARIIRERARQLVQQKGVDIRGREKSIRLLMLDYGISSNSAVGYLRWARKQVKT